MLGIMLGLATVQHTLYMYIHVYCVCVKAYCRTFIIVSVLLMLTDQFLTSGAEFQKSFQAVGHVSVYHWMLCSLLYPSCG